MFIMLQITIGANVTGHATSIKHSIYKHVKFLVSISLHGHDEHYRSPEAAAEEKLLL